MKCARNRRGEVPSTNGLGNPTLRRILGLILIWIQNLNVAPFQNAR